MSHEENKGFMSRLNETNVMSDGMLRPVDYTQLALVSSLPRKRYKIKDGYGDVLHRS